MATTRPVFHSEADFQHALAWHIHERHPNVKVRLEYRPPAVGRKVYVDIWLEHADAICAIELKYKTRRLTAKAHGESFDLLNQGAHDVARYDVCKDVCRVEELVKAYPGLVGYAVFLTNDPGYWQRSGRDGTVDAAFRLHDGAVLQGELSWREHASPGTTSGRTSLLCLCGTHQVRWVDYSDVGGASGQFRVLTVAVRAT
ncbi:MAG: hypothetical protein KJZ65_12475 [Phycisphaerales bacterium]|nr:hypothetical protein [Phycisphaerales bacterium]